MFSDLPNQAARACQWTSTAEMWNNIFIGNSGRKKVFLIDCLGHKIAHELAQKFLVRLGPFLCSRMMSRWMLNNFSDGYSTLMVSLSCILKIMLISQSINQRKKYSFKRGRWLGTDPPLQYFHLQWFRRASPVLQEAPWSVSSTTVGSLNLTFGPGRTQKPVILRLNQIHTEVSDQTESDESHTIDLEFSSSHETERSCASSFSWHSLSANTDIIVLTCTGRRNIPFETSKMKSWLFSCQ